MYKNVSTSKWKRLGGRGVTLYPQGDHVDMMRNAEGQIYVFFVFNSVD